VKVDAVRTANFHGKMRPPRPERSYRRDWKKAYVKLRKAKR